VERVGNIRGLDDDAVPGDPGRGRSDEARAEHDPEVERVGNIRGLDDDASDDESVDGDRPVDDDDAPKRGPLERARERVDEALGRRDPDAERRQPE
jgi:hypothetical protein